MNVSRLLVLSVCCLCHLIWGSITTPTYYVNAFKVQYNYTQSQVELILPMLSFGKVLSPIPAVVYQTWGFGLTLLSGLTLSSGGYLCLWGSGFFLEICYTYPILVYTCFLFLGLGSAFLNLSVLTAITINFPGKHQGKAVSTVMTSYAVSPLMTLFVYRKWFAHGEIENDAGQDLHGFMLYSAVSVAMMAALFLGVSRLINRPEPPETPLLNDCDSEDTTKPRDKKLTSLRDKVVQEIQTIFQWPLQMIIWSFALTYSVYSGIDYNLALYAKSSGVYFIFDSVFVVFHVTLFLSRLAVGFVSDALAGTIPRTLYNALSSFLLAVCLCLASILPTAEVTIYMLSITAGLAGGVVRPTIVTVLAQNMGKENFAKYWGIAYSVTSITLSVWAVVFSSLHSASGQTEGQDCYGSHCFQWVNLITCTMAAVSTCCSLSLALIKRY